MKFFKFCLDILNRKKAIDCINNTTIVMLPKIDHLEEMTQFKPISLCNVIYKLVTKTIVNKLRVFLDGCIDNAQVVFVLGRQITDNALIAYEILHSLKIRKGGRQGQFALKLNLNKAYDLVEWGYIKKVMLRLGFYEEWVSLVMSCVKSVDYSVIMNGNC